MSTETEIAPAKKAKRIVEATHVLSIDVECTGSNVLKNWMPEFGAALWKIGAQESQSTFYRCLAAPPNTEWSERTLAQFWNNPDKGFDGMTPMQALVKRQAANGQCDPIGAIHDFVAWARSLEKEKAEGDNIIIIFDTGGFDATWMNVYLARAGYDGLEELFGVYRPMRDSNSFYFGVGRALSFWGSEDCALAELGIPAVPAWVEQYKHNHDPLSDANEIAAVASFIVSACKR